MSRSFLRPKHFVTLFLVMLGFALLLLVLSPTPALAAGIVTICNEANLRAALNGGGTVTFACSGTIDLTSTITITLGADTVIDGSGQNVIISGSSLRVFTVNAGAALKLRALTVAGAGTWGGGAISNMGTLDLSDCTFDSNRAYGAGCGGAIMNTGMLTVRNSRFSRNEVIRMHITCDAGGAIANSGTLVISSSTFTDNFVSGEGGAIANFPGGQAMVRDSTFSDNSVACPMGPGVGGGIMNWGILQVTNSTFSGNSASGSGMVGGYGGGIGNWGTLQVINSTFSGNFGNQGGGISNRGGTATLMNTIVANSLEGGNCAGIIIDGSGNLSYPDSTCPGINGDPRLGPLQNNGGLTPTMALLPGSAALDAADDAICAAPPVNNCDQRGYPRPIGPYCDIGAYELFLPTDYRYLPIVGN